MKPFVISAVVSLVAGHGYITSPQPRVVGDAMESACGSQIWNMLKADVYGNIQGEQQLIQSDFNANECNLWLCKGMQYKDNTANVQSYTAGQTVDIKYDIRAPHTGTANVSIVDTASNTVIGSPLARWSVFASNSGGDTANETSFSITMPSDLGSKCSTAGACVIQHYWNSDEARQTYESCIDFTVGGSGSSSGGSSSSATVTSPAAAVTNVANTAAPSSTVAPVTSAAPATTSSASAEDDGTCDADDEEPTTTSTAVEAEATGDDSDNDSCDDVGEPDETPVASSAAPTTLVTRTSAATAATSAASSSGSLGTVDLYGRCGGIGYTGSTTCASGNCKVQNDYYSQCI